MRSSPFVPARNSRHRHAALALCRALLRHGGRIPLPKALSPPVGEPNPVKALVIHQFRKNKGDTSPRLVLAALTGGYKFLSLFSKAKDPDSPSHAEVTAYIQKRLAENNGRITKESRRKPAPPPRPPRPPPLLVTKTDDDGLDIYERNFPPTPFEKLKDGKRHIPRLFVTSYNMAFLRMKKPQPFLLSQNIRSVSARLQKQIGRLQEMQDEDMPMAKDEDQWERMMERLAEEASPVARRQDGRPRDESSEESKARFADSVFVGLRHTYRDIRRQRINSITRVQALTRIVEEERRLAREEAPRRRALAEKAGAENSALAKMASATKASATKASALKAPAEKAVAETTALAEKAAVTKASATKAPAKASARKAPAERAPAERAPAERAPAERAPAERAPAERAPAERAPAERAPAEKTLTRKAPPGKTLTEKPKKQTKQRRRAPEA